MTRVGDMKAGLTSSRPKLSIVGRHSMIHQCRGTEYGADKYARGNYHGPPPEKVTTEARVMGYVDAALRHLTAISDAYNRALGTGGDVRAAIALPDLEASGGFPASGLPHLSHVMAGIGIAIECAVQDGLLPADPGQPWKAGAEDSLPQKDDPAAERARVAALREKLDADEREQTLGPLPPKSAEQVRTDFNRVLRSDQVIEYRYRSGRCVVCGDTRPIGLNFAHPDCFASLTSEQVGEVRDRCWGARS